MKQDNFNGIESVNSTDYPKTRELDGIYFRIERKKHWENVCFSDLTADERVQVTEGRSLEWMKRLAFMLADAIREIGDQFGIENAWTDDEE